MSDIFGRSTSRPADGITRRQITSMIKRYVASGLNLVDVDPGEIIVFQDKEGKLKSSDLSINDLLIKQPNAADDSIVVFKSGKLAPSHNIKILDKITEVETDLDGHMKDYKQFRRNVIAKFFGSPLVVTPSLTEIKNSIEDSASAIKDINNLKTITDTVKKDIADIKTITDKVKIPHDTNDVKGISYVVFQELDEEYLKLTGAVVFLHKTTVVGLYRFTVFSEHQFEIKIVIKSKSDSSEITEHKGTNTVLLYVNDVKKQYYAIVNPVKDEVVRAKFGCILEYVSAI